jgi:hypothetical protein
VEASLSDGARLAVIATEGLERQHLLLLESATSFNVREEESELEKSLLIANEEPGS